MTAPGVRVVVADDSATARALLVEILRAGGLEVVGEAADGAAAAAMVRDLRPSVVVMDIHMPGVDGFEATTRIMAETPTPIVIVTAGHDPRNVAMSFEATRVGALTLQPKPTAPASPGFEAESTRLVSLVRAMADVKVVGRRGGGRRARHDQPGPPPATETTTRVRIVGVGASTGGPTAVYEFLAALPADLHAPVLVVQHIPDGYVTGLVRWLDVSTSLAVRVAEHGARLEDGVVYVAPHGTHLEAGPGSRVRLTTGPLVDGFRPSVSALFSSLADHYRSAAAGVVLTGMGSDGLLGARRLRQRGGVVLAQDQATSAVFGMPRVVSDPELAQVVGPVDDLARAIGELTTRHRKGRP